MLIKQHANWDLQSSFKPDLLLPFGFVNAGQGLRCDLCGVEIMADTYLILQKIFSSLEG